MELLLIVVIICIISLLIAKRAAFGFYDENKRNESIVHRLTQLKVINADEKQPAKDINFLMEIRRLELLSAIKNIGLFFMILTLVSLLAWAIYLLVIPSML